MLEELKQLTNTRFMTRLFEEHLAEFSNKIAVCSVERAPRPISSIQPSRQIPSLSFLYKLEVIEANNKRAGVKRIVGQVFPLTLSRNLRARSPRIPSAKNTVLHFSGFELVLWVFPVDPVLAHLPDCLDPNKVKLYLPFDSLPEPINHPDDITEIHVRPLNYLPENRCTTRYELQWKPLEIPSTGTVIGKTFSDARGKDLFKLMQQIWKRSLSQPKAFRVAQPLEYNDTIQTVWNGVLRGTPVTQCLDNNNYQKYSELIARALANFHNSQFSSFATVQNRGNISDIAQKTHVLMQALPKLRIRFESILSQLEKNAACLTGLPRTPIHGSFRIKEMIVQDGQLGLFDFDNCTLGDPICDVGTFLADLHRRASESSFYSRLGKGFLSAYREHVDWEVSEMAVHWHFQVRLLEKVYWRFENKWFDPHLEKHIERILSLLEKGISMGL